MTGNHSAAWLADAWFKGVRNFDLKTGLRRRAQEFAGSPRCSRGARRPNARWMISTPSTAITPPCGRARRRPISLVDTNCEKRQAVAVTLDQSYDDWCTAQLARELGNSADYDLLPEARGELQECVSRGQGVHVAEGRRRAIGLSPLIPSSRGGPGGRDYFTENNAYTYNWDVQHDYNGLFELMGGRRAAEAKLDQLFREDLGRPKYEFWAMFPDSTGMVGQFSMGNEPSMAIPYIYNHLGAPWKTQKRVRQLLESWFPDTIMGIPGDEDGGGMSAFVVFSMMGFYPVVPGRPAL